MRQLSYKILIRKICRIFQNLVIVNFFVFLPLVLTLCWSTSDRLDVVVSADRDLTVSVCSGNGNEVRSAECVTEGEGRAASLYYADGLDESDIRLVFSVNDDDVRLRRVSLTRHFLFKKDIVSLSPVVWSGYSLDLAKKWWNRLVLIELFLLIVAWMGLFLKCEDTFLAKYVQPLIIASHGALFFGFVIPMGTWLGSRDLFTFPLSELLPETMMAVGAIFMALFICLYMSRWAFDRFVMTMVVALLVYEYLLTGMLSTQLPVLDGDFGVQWVGLNCQADWITMFIVFAVFVMSYHWVKRYLHFVSLGILVLSFVSIADVMISKKDNAHEKKNFPSNSISDIVRSVVYSAKRNVIVLVVDSVRADVAARLVKDNLELKKKFNGFIAFDDNLGMHPWSHFGVPGFLTGKYYTPGNDRIAYLDSQREEDSYVYAYERAGAAIYFGTDTPRHQFTNRLKTDEETMKVDTHEKYGLRWRTKEIPYVSLFEVIRMRIVPMYWKAYTLKNAFIGIGDGGGAKLKREKFLYPFLANAPISDVEGLALIHFHTTGAHPPHNRDRYGNVVSSSRLLTEAEYEHTYHVFDELGTLFDMYRERGIYDKSIILVVSDHGTSVADRPGENGKSHPMLWVKPIGSRGELLHNMMATSHDKIRDLLVEALNHDLTIHECEEKLLSPRRRFICVNHDGSPVHDE